MSFWSQLTEVRYHKVVSAAFKRLMLIETGKLTPDAETVVAHMRHFCFADVSTIQRDRTGRVDALASAQMAGRQEAWLQFNLYLNLNDNDLVEADRRLIDLVKSEANAQRRSLDS